MEQMRDPDFQVVIVVDYDDGRMFPMTEDIPKCLLPIANRSLLSYQLDMLDKSGAEEVFIAAPIDYEAELMQFIVEYRGSTLNDKGSTNDGATKNDINVSIMSIDLVFVDEMMGSADGLRAVGERIRGDFIVMSSDFMSQFTLGDLTKLHKLQTSDLTMMLTVSPVEVKKDEVDQEFIGIYTNNGRVVMKTPTLEIDEDLSISKSLLHKEAGNNLQMRKDLLDVGVYVMSHWVLEYITANKRISSIKADLVPQLVKRQFQTAEYVHNCFPSLQHRNRPLQDIEPWLVSQRGATGLELPELLNDPTSNQPVSRNSGVLLTVPSLDGKDGFDGAVSSISKSPCNPGLCRQSSGVVPSQSDLIRCFAIVYDIPAYPSPAPNAVVILHRVNNIATYMSLNKELPFHQHTIHTPWPRNKHYLKKENSTIGDGTDISAKNVTVKQCSIGQNCSIGAMVKLNNCVIMDNVTIGEQCTIQNCVISSRVIIENGCNLNECNIGSGYKMPSGSKIKSEVFTSSAQ